MRIGHGYDIHRFGAGDHIILGGVAIPHTHSLIAHSDGDVLIHALCDALLGAAGLGDIGHHFPDNDLRYAGADSRTFLRAIYSQIQAKGWQLSNADISIIAQVPKLSTYCEAIRANMAQDLQAAIEQINIKATTAEGLGPIGRQEGLAEHAVVLLTETIITETIITETIKKP